MQFAFADYRLDPERRELHCAGALVALEPQVFDLLLYLLRNRDRVVSKDDLLNAVWGGRVVSESTLTSRINAARRAVGDSGEEQRVIRTIPRKGFRFVAAVEEAAQRAQGEPLPRSTVRQETRFCRADDGVRIAYAEVGQGPALVKTANWLNHLDYDWQSPIWSPTLHAFAQRYRLIRYDARGNGLSDWDIEEMSLDAFVDDLESVVDAMRLDRFALLGMSQGCAVAIAYALRHPDRVTHLVLYGGFARGRRRRGQAGETEQADLLQDLILQGWGKENPAFRQFFTSLFIPGGSAEQMRWYNDLQRITTSPQNAARLRRVVDDMDISDLLPLVSVPTLVMHCRDDAVQPFDEGRRLAAEIPGALFVALEGRNHVILEGDPGWSRFFGEIENFLGPVSAE